LEILLKVNRFIDMSDRGTEMQGQGMEVRGRRAHLLDEAVGVPADHVDGVAAIGLVDLGGQRRRHVVRLQGEGEMEGIGEQVRGGQREERKGGLPEGRP
jgi:hypothetical protein